jgi:Flp pilus assembly pilin Flp
MQTVMSQAKAFIQDAEGAGAMEYCLLIVGIAIGLLTAIYAIGAKVNLLLSPLSD